MRKLLSLVLILGGLALFLYPLGSSLFNEGVVRSEFSVYKEKYENNAEEDNENILRAAREYNDSLLTLQVSLQDPFKNKLNDENTRQAYDTLLSCGGQGLMGFLEIPCIGEKLPIYHGTSDETLKKGVGHLMGSSLPVGGESTHAVLTGHTGMNRAKIFTDLNRVRTGDLFFIYAAGETLAYRVDQILVVLPEDTTALSVIRGEDLVTLVTCTPYGVNDHRLLVRGSRTEYSDSLYEKENNKEPEASSDWMQAYKRSALAGILCLCGLKLFGYIKKKCKFRGHEKG